MPIILTTWEAEIRRISLRPAQANSSQDPHQQNNQSKMDWRCGSSGRGPVLQVQSPELKPQSHQKKKKKAKVSKSVFSTVIKN
jgi:hypothetical protein